MIDIAMLSTAPVAVLGLGRSGMAAAKALLGSRILVWGWDDDAKVRAVAGQASIPLVDLYLCDMRQPTMLVLSPGIPHTHPKPHPVVERARTAGCEIIGDVELLIRAQQDATYVAVTGTNGKSTTTALIGHVLGVADRNVAVGGNLGMPALELAALGAGSIYALEMSSYQLELTPSLAPDVAVLLNISPDHLDRHGGIDGYIAAKRLIFKRQRPGSTAVVGIDDPLSRKVCEILRTANAARVIAVSGREAVRGGVYVSNGTLRDDTDGSDVAVLDMAETAALPGEHNAQNAAAAFAAARALGIESDIIVDATLGFSGLAHRQERIAVINGVAYVNDSKATNADAAARALACYDAIYWIAGGQPKDGGLDPVAPWLDRVRHAFLIGEAAEPFARELEGRVPLTRSITLDAAVVAARARAESEQAAAPVVLLSPACASFDQFRNFEDRGDAFRALVEAMA